MDTCKDIMEYLAAYVDGELEGELRERVRRHVEACEHCRTESAGLKKVVELYRGSPAPEVRTEDWEKVTSALEACMTEAVPMETVSRRVERRRLRVLWWLVPAGALAAAVLIAALIIGLAGPAAPVRTYVTHVTVETDPHYEAIVRIPLDEDDFLVIDVVNVE